MKLKILVQYNCDTPAAFKICNIKKGDWIDLRAAESYIGSKGDFTLLSLGVAMQLPKGFEAIVNPRSSTFLKYNFIMPNSQGVIDNTYCGSTDIWKCPALFMGSGKVNKGDRICQFRIQLSQNASMWNKLKWLFSSKIEFKEVKQLNNIDRGGFGSTGKNTFINK